MTALSPTLDTLHGQGDWQARLNHVLETMREISRHSDPQQMFETYSQRMRQLLPVDGSVSLSRRGLEYPHYRITRSSLWPAEHNPWKDAHRLPLLSGGLLAELIYSNLPRIVDDLVLPDDEPAREYLQGHSSLMAAPLFDDGVSANMVVLLRQPPAAFNRERLPEFVWMSNLFGRATYALVLGEKLRSAYEQLDHEMRAVGEIQRQLLPEPLPKIPTLDLAAFYQTSQRAGGDYYDFFELPDGRWGILIADVSGHGTPAAVFMAIANTIAHEHCAHPSSPSGLLGHMNRRMCERYARDAGTFITAFYGVYDPRTRELHYASAGHPAPRVKRCQTGDLQELNGAGGLPLGVETSERYEEATYTLVPGDQIVFYTDGITEAMNGRGELFGTERLDEALENCHLSASGLIETVLAAVNLHTNNGPVADDRTVLVARVV